MSSLGNGHHHHHFHHNHHNHHHHVILGSNSLDFSSNLTKAGGSERLIGLVSKPSLWKTLDKAWMTTTGYHAHEFQFVRGVTPFSTWSETIGMIVLYLVVILGGREFMKTRAPLKLNTLFKIHNLFLTVLSASLLALFAGQLVPQIWQVGLYDNICGLSGWTPQLVTLYYLNYLTKYFELIDTVFLMVRKKPLTFLHTYHHPATALLCFTQLAGQTPVSWVPITLNLTVHVVMYWYYFQAARGVKIWWKEWITRLQIIQFVLDLGFVYFAIWDYYASAYRPWLPHIGRCRGTPLAAWSGMFILSSYLVLFIMFYIATYRKKPQASKKVTSTTDLIGTHATSPSENGHVVTGTNTRSVGVISFTADSGAKLAERVCAVHKRQIAMVDQIMPE